MPSRTRSKANESPLSCIRGIIRHYRNHSAAANTTPGKEPVLMIRLGGAALPILDEVLIFDIGSNAFWEITLAKLRSRPEHRQWLPSLASASFAPLAPAGETGKTGGTELRRFV